MFHIALLEPEIPPNTGNIIRLCANTATELHLIKPFGFNLEDKKLKRASLDYHEWARVHLYDNYPVFLKQLQPKRIFACSTKGKRDYNTVQFQPDDVLLFGAETRGLPGELLQQFASEHILRIPMHENSRSLNLSNAVAIILYEALRQCNFAF